MKFRNIFLLFFGLLTHLQVFTQNIKFTEKPEEFVNTLTSMMATVGNEQAIAVGKNIGEKWTFGKITEP